MTNRHMHSKCCLYKTFLSNTLVVFSKHKYIDPINKIMLFFIQLNKTFVKAEFDA
jgi:hypothetical protein